MNNAAAPERTWLNGLLFVLTVLTACYAGLAWSASFLYASAGPGADALAAPGRVLQDPRLFPLSGLYAAVLMTILLGHELGHYLTCRRYGVRATLPFFLPGPPFLGTFGAFIRIKSPLYFKRQVFDVGANGPLAGFALTVPALALGMALSKVAPFTPSADTLSFGEPLLFKLMAAFILGPVPRGSEIILHPIGWAAWVGLLVTSLNLVPLGQLDGGHIAYAVLGRRARLLSLVMVFFMAVMGVFFHMTWLLMAAVVLIFEFKSKQRLKHPEVVDEAAPLDPKRRILAFLILAIFVMSFIPAPVEGVSLIDLVKGAL
jgi:membrane-associated protease RseP (regulator of RpoE activity)